VSPDQEKREETPVARVSSGDRGLDTILHGGWLQGGLYLVLGAPGAGKTILGNQFCFHHVEQGGRAIYVTVLAESHGRMLTHLRPLGFFRQEVIGPKLSYVSGYATLRAKGVQGLLQLLTAEVRERQASALVIDGLSAVEDSAGSRLALREFLHGLSVHNAMAGCTTLLLTNHQAESSDPEYAMVDGIIRLSAELIGLKAIRGLEVTKSRGSAQLAGKHTFDITSEGVRAYPRTEALYAGRSKVVPKLDERLSFGLEGLDQMLGGGLVRYSSTLILGSPGAGKTTLGLNFLAAGAKKGEPGMYFGFAETPERLAQKCVALGLDLSSLIEKRQLFLESRVPVETLPDALVQELLAQIEREHIQRLFLDGLEPFAKEAIDPERTSRFVTALTNALRDRGVTALFTQQTNTLVGPELYAPLRGVEAIVDNIVLLRYLELRGELRRMFSILKMRESAHDLRLREFVITPHGVDVGDMFDNADSLLTGEARATTPEAGKAKSKRRAGRGKPR